MNKHTFQGICRHLFRQMVRATVKSLLVIVVALGIFLTLGWLQETIDRNEQEITRLYETTYVFGQILPGDAYSVVRQQLGSGYIRKFLADMITIIAEDLVADVYYEAGMPWAFITDLDVALIEDPDDADITMIEDVLNEMISDAFEIQNHIFFMEHHTEWLHQITAISCIDLFIQRNTPTTGILDVEMAGLSLEIEFAPGLDETSFVYEDVLLRAPIPIILSEDIMTQNGFAFGDLVAINYYDLNLEHPNWERLEGEIIGVYYPHTTMQETIFLPFSAWDRVNRLMRDEVYLTTLEFLVDPMLNRVADSLPQNARVILESIVRNVSPGLILDMHEAQLRFTVQTMEENVSLLWLLYPVVIIVSLMIAGAASFFLTLQNAKNIAMMRIFGITRKRASLIVWFEQIILCLIGLVLGLSFLMTFGWGFGIVELLGVAGLYLLSVMVGSIAGIIIIVRQAPLELLQVRE